MSCFNVYYYTLPGAIIPSGVMCMMDLHGDYPSPDSYSTLSVVGKLCLRTCEHVVLRQEGAMLWFYTVLRRSARCE